MKLSPEPVGSHQSAITIVFGPAGSLSIRANWLRNAEPGSKAVVVVVDATGRTLVDVGGVSLVYGVEGLHRG